MATKYRLKTALMVLLLPLYGFSSGLADKYPGYAYVFSEFGVDESYIYDSSFEYFVLKNEKKIKNFYERSMKKGEKLLPLMKDHLMIDGLSDLFIYISMIESGFSPAIVSSKKAVGLWQFMPSTAKHYDLAVCNAVDERCDPVSSTNAAINYLKKLNDQFGKWYLAAMAYNCGEGRLEKAIRKAGTDELSILLDENEKYLPKETRDYIKKILLAAMIGENELLDFDEVKTSGTDPLIQVEVASGTKLADIAKLLNIATSELLALNKQYKNGVIPKEKHLYKIMIPEEVMMLFYLKYEIKEEKNVLKPHFISHYVALGDTLDSLAKKYETSQEEIKTANKLEDEALTLDALLLIPVAEALFEKMLSE